MSVLDEVKSYKGARHAVRTKATLTSITSNVVAVNVSQRFGSMMRSERKPTKVQPQAAQQIRSSEQKD
jgi:hypothetical protein